MKENIEIICYCKSVTKGEILTAIDNGAKTLADIQQATGAGTGKSCLELHPEKRCCHKDIFSLLGTTPNMNNCCCGKK